LSEQKESIGELEELNLQSAKLEETYRRIFYKVDPALVFDLVTRLQQDPKNPNQCILSIRKRWNRSTEIKRSYIEDDWISSCHL
jgi:hypothetical protein